jgi:hypothetical protein
VGHERVHVHPEGKQHVRNCLCGFLSGNLNWTTRQSADRRYHRETV